MSVEPTRLAIRPPALQPSIVVVAFGAVLGWRALAMAPPPVPAVANEPGTGELEIVVRDAESDAPIAARVRVDGVELTPEPARRTIITSGAPAMVTLPRGRYRLLASRGPEWTMATELVEVAPGARRVVDLSIRHAIDPVRYVPCDFHVHASPSPDSDVGLEDRVASLAAEGIRFAVATDHNHVTDYAPAARALGLRDFASAPGVEVTTWEPQFGHFNAWPLVPDPSDPRRGAPRFRNTTPSELFGALRALGPDVIVQVNHPRLDHIGYFDHRDRQGREASLDVDAVEVWNGYELRSTEALDRNLADWMALLSRGHRVVATGNSDSHDVDRHPAGYPRTYVRLSGSNEPDAASIARALRAGHAFVTSGPFLDVSVEGRGPGETVHTDGVARLDVEVRSPPWIDVTRVEVWMNGALVLVEALHVEEPPLTNRATLRVRRANDPAVRRRRMQALLEVQEDAYVIVVARGDAPITALFDRRIVHPVAFTNPIWLRAR